MMAPSPTYLKILKEAPGALPEPHRRVRGKRLTLQTLLYADTIAAEFILSMVSLLCGVWVLLPFEAFSAPFMVFPAVFNEMLCGVWLTFLGSSRLAILWSGHIKYRQIMAFLSFVTWLNLSAWLFIMEPERLSVVFFVVCSSASFWIFLREPSRVLHRPQEVNPCDKGRHE